MAYVGKRKRDYYGGGAAGYAAKRIRYDRSAPIRRRGYRRKSLYYRRKNFRTAGFLSIERKFYDTFLVDGVIPSPTDCTGGEFDPSATSMITTPTQGDGEQQRDGKQICTLYLEINGVVYTDALEAAAGLQWATDIFVACVLDTQTNAAQMNSEDCFKNNGASAVLAANPIRNLLFGKRFKILKEKRFTMNNGGVTQQAANDYSIQAARQAFKWFIPLKNMKINFNAGTTASVANVIDNSIHIIAFANLTTLAPKISYNARLRFMG